MTKYKREYFLSERVFEVRKRKNGKGDVYGMLYLPKEFIGKKVILKILTEQDKEIIEIFSGSYSSDKKKKRVERRYKK